MKSLSWVCPTCSIARRKAVILNSAPYSGHKSKEAKNQGNNHLGGRRHKRAVSVIGASLTSLEHMNFFFGDCIGWPIPDWTRITPDKALREYIEERCGDPDKAIADVTVPPPPIAARPTVVKRNIKSSAYASTRHNNVAAYCKLLCCWDDPAESKVCLRTSCPYQHCSDIAKRQPNAPGQDFFEFMPCTFQGMTGKIDGCARHRLRFMSPNTWCAPQFELSEETSGEASSQTHNPPEGVELVPMLVGQMWVLQEADKQKQETITADALFEIRMSNSIDRFLKGCESDAEMSSEM